MHTYICLLRGINVSGKNKIKMADLRALLSRHDFLNVTTYIQSGNIRLESPDTKPLEVGKKIKDIIQEEYGYDIRVLVLESNQLSNVIPDNPFLSKGRNEDIKYLSVTFLSSLPHQDLVDAIKNFKHKEDEFIIIDDRIYIFTPGGYGRTKLTNNFFERKLKVSCTTRNWKTTLKLVEMIS